MPDIDIDIDVDDRRRGEVLDYAIARWGRGRIAQIVSFSAIKQGPR
jgi:DNA polymerase III alpha subunit